MSTEDYEPEYPRHGSGQEEYRNQEEYNRDEALQEEYQDEEHVYDLEYEVRSQDDVESFEEENEEEDEEEDEGEDEEEDEEENEEETDHYEGEYVGDDPGPGRGECHSISFAIDSSQPVTDGEEGSTRRTSIESSPTMPGSLYARSPEPEPEPEPQAHHTRSRHVRFAPGVISPAVRPPRRVPVDSPQMLLAITPGRINPADPQKPRSLQHTYPSKLKRSPIIEDRKPQEMERIRQLEEEVKMLREEVGLALSHKNDPL